MRKEKEGSGLGRREVGGWIPGQFDKPCLIMTLCDCAFTRSKCTVCAACTVCADVLCSLSPSLPLLPPFLLLPVLPSLPSQPVRWVVASKRAVEGSVAAASIWSCNGVKKSGLTDRRQSHRASLKTDPLDKEIIERWRQLGGPSVFLDVFIFFSLLAPSYYVH